MTMRYATKKPLPPEEAAEHERKPNRKERAEAMKHVLRNYKPAEKKQDPNRDMAKKLAAEAFGKGRKK